LLLSSVQFSKNNIERYAPSKLNNVSNLP